MHDGCSGCFDSGEQIADKVRMMGFDQSPVPKPLDIDCQHCGGAFTMETVVSVCPACSMVCAVTPCHCSHVDHVLPAGIGYWRRLIQGGPVKSLPQMEARLKALASAIKETEARLPAHSAKPPVMMELLALEDEYEQLAMAIRSHRSGHAEIPAK